MSTEVTHPIPAAGSARAKVAEFEAAAASIPVPAAPMVPDMTPVPVTGTPRVANGDDCTAKTIRLNSNNASALALPQDPQRYRAVLISSASSVFLCSTREAAQEVAINGSLSAGALMPANVAIELRDKAVWYVADSTPATPCTVSVIVERYAAEG